MIFNPIHEFQIPLLNVCIKPCRIENMPLYFQSRLSEGWPGCFHPKHEKWSSISYTFFPSFFFFFFFRWGVGLKEGDVVKKLYKKFVGIVLLASFHQRMSSMELVLRKQS